MTAILEQTNIDFYRYPPVGSDDWEYAYETAHVRALETGLLNKAALLEMANAESFAAAVDLLGSSEYALSKGGQDIGRLEGNLRASRTAVRELFEELMREKEIVRLFKARDDFVNLRLSLRRTLTERPIGTDYSGEGNMPPEQFDAVFGEENYELMPEYMQEAVEGGVLGYYQNKDIRQIDYAVDAVEATYKLRTARRLESIFLLGLFRIQIDLTNIRTMLRVRFTESEQRNVFLEGGHIEVDRLKEGLDIGSESLGQLFYATPYFEVVDSGASYLNSNKSFLKLEQQCEEYLAGFLKTTTQITAGPQPVVAYLLTKENEIRTVRLILTAKKNELDTRLILDRIGG